MGPFDYADNTMRNEFPVGLFPKPYVPTPTDKLNQWIAKEKAVNPLTAALTSYPVVPDADPTDQEQAVQEETPEPAQPQVGVPAAPAVRPGIQGGVPIYRHEPQTRELVFGGLEAPGAAAKLEDQLSYKQQILDAMSQRGFHSMNSPQYAQMSAELAAGQQALSGQMGAQAQMASAQAQQTGANAELAKTSPEFMEKQALLRAGELNPPLFQEPGYQQKLGLPKTAAQMGLGAHAPDLKRAIPSMQAMGINSITQGSPEHAVLMGLHGPEVQALLAGDRYHWFGRGDITPQEYKGFVKPAPPASTIPKGNAPVAAPTLPAKTPANVGVKPPLAKPVAVYRGVRKRDQFGNPIERV